MLADLERLQATQTLVRMASQWPAQDIEALVPWNVKSDGVWLTAYF